MPFVVDRLTIKIKPTKHARLHVYILARSVKSYHPLIMCIHTYWTCKMFECLSMKTDPSKISHYTVTVLWYHNTFPMILAVANLCKTTWCSMILTECTHLHLRQKKMQVLIIIMSVLWLCGSMNIDNAVGWVSIMFHETSSCIVFVWSNSPGVVWLPQGGPAIVRNTTIIIIITN